MENSRYAVELARHYSYPIIEIDVKLTGDGNLIAMHDYTTGRNTVGLSKNTAIAQLKFFSLLNLHLRGTNPAGEASKNTDSPAYFAPTIKEEVPTLLQILHHVWHHARGSVVILDLRHRKEVEAAMYLLANLSIHFPERKYHEWVILKPFANVFPAGAKNLPVINNGHGKYGYNSFYWIHCLSGRIGKWNKVPRTESNVPGTMGPDNSLLQISLVDYIEQFYKLNPSRTLAFEIGGPHYDRNNPPLKDDANGWDFHRAQEYYAKLGRGKLTSWRPVDVWNRALKGGYPSTSSKFWTFEEKGQWVQNMERSAIIGWKFRDDGTGMYDVAYTKEHRALYNKKAAYEHLIVDDAVRARSMAIRNGWINYNNYVNRLTDTKPNN